MRPKREAAVGIVELPPKDTLVEDIEACRFRGALKEVASSQSHGVPWPAILAMTVKKCSSITNLVWR
jgi:hypothetical protein